MNGVAPGDAGREGRGRSNSGVSVDYVRDGAMAAHKKMSGTLLTKLGISRTSPEPSPKHVGATTPSFASSPMDNGGGGATAIGVQASGAAEAASKAAMSAIPKRPVPLPPAIMTTPGRNRKGSLRKNILQRGSLQRMETILSPRAISQMSDRTDSSESVASFPSSEASVADEDDDYPTPRVSYDKGSRTLNVVETSDRSYEGREKLHIDPGLASQAASLSRSSTLRDNSTTDEDEKPPGSSSSNASSDLMMAVKRPTPTDDSYFPPQLSGPGVRKRSPLKIGKTTKSSPLSALPLDAATPAPLSPEIWDYAETEWWGWIILFVTWVTFVVGMGSCFDAWSWAWDVGETPYAPPELEDDPTLPIVGYYPALIVLTGVMAWVWVIIAWVGMKYFKHAKMSGDDG